MPTFFFHSGMAGAPTNTNAAGSTLEIIRSCLVTGFNLKSVVSASVASGVMTLTYAAPHGYEDKVWLRLDGAAGGSIVQRVTTTAGASTLTIPAPGFADGAVAGTLSTRVAPADWEEAFTDINVGVFRSKVEGPASTRFFYRVSDSAAGETFYVRGFESMTDVDTGLGAFPTVAQQSGQGVLWQRSIQSSANPWMVVADGRTCFLLASRSGASQLTGGFFGDCYPFSSADLFFAGLARGNISVNPLSESASWAVPREYSGAGTATTNTTLQTFAGAASGTRHTYPSAVDGGMVLQRPALVFSSNSMIRGQIRGLTLCSSNPIPTGSWFVVFNNLPGISGRLVVVRSAYESQQCVAFPIDEEWA